MTGFMKCKQTPTTTKSCDVTVVSTKLGDAVPTFGTYGTALPRRTVHTASPSLKTEATQRLKMPRKAQMLFVVF
jgi:hypothetical protein